MDNCKKCGTELRKTNKIISVVENSEASKNLSKGDIVVSVDEKNVKSLSDIEKAISENKTCKITIMHDDQRKSVSIDAPIEYFKSIEFESENVCSKCGAKQKGSKIPLIVGIIIFIVVLVFLLLFVVSKRNRQVTYSSTAQNQIITNNKNEEKKDEFELPKVEVLTEQQKKKVENDIDKKRSELEADGKNEESRYEEIPESEMEKNDFDKELHKELEERYQELFGSEKEEDDNPFEDVTSGGPIEKESKGGVGLGANKTQSDKPAVDKVVRISFDYGSYLNAKNIYMANYLKGSQSIETSADIEYAEFYLALDELLKSIPENKRNKAIFAVVG